MIPSNITINVTKMSFGHPNNECNERGFTLMEILIALLISGMAMAAIYTTSNKQQDVYVDQDQVVAMQDNLRAAMLLMTREIRMAGYDPTMLANAGITIATSNTLTFTMDDNDDGDTADTDENITFDLYTSSGVQRLGRKNPTINRLVAENISNLEFYYTLANGAQTLAPATLADIRVIQITVLASTATTTSNSIGQTSFTTPSGAAWTLATGYRGRMQSVTVKCRNMGL